MGIAVNMFSKGSSPVLEQALSFSEQRHRVIARNIANIETPDFTPLDLDEADFRATLDKAIALRDSRPVRTFSMLDGRHTYQSNGLKALHVEQRSFLRNGGNGVDLDSELSKLSRNGLQYRTWATILQKQYALLRDTIAERV